MKGLGVPISRIVPLADEAPSPRRLGNVHWGPAAAAILLSSIGLATVHSASAELEVSYLPRQALWVGLGCLALAAAFVIDYRRLVDMAPIFYGLGLALLAMVLVIGEVRGGARSWLGLGPLGGQPSEIAKLTTALLLVRYLSRIPKSHLDLGQILKATVITAVPMALVALERDLGGAAMFLPILVGLLLVAGVRWRQLVIMAGLGLVIAAGMWTFGLREYQRSRVMSFLAPEQDPLGAGYQVRQSKIAVGSGQWTGRGYGQGTQSQLRFLPERHTDFIMAVLAEEWGFLGVVAVLALYSSYFSSGASIAARARDRTGILLVAGLLSLLAFHTVYNTAMVVGMVPVTGIPLPFLSYGGSFVLLCFVVTGLVLNVDYRRYVNR
ncbi:MAG: rod shape-determining protein RodA [Thermoanaerobaculia bacterium]